MTISDPRYVNTGITVSVPVGGRAPGDCQFHATLHGVQLFPCPWAVVLRVTMLLAFG